MNRILPQRGRNLAWIAGLCMLLGGCIDDLRLTDPDVVFVAFGGSTTAGPSERDYPDLLALELGQPSRAFANEGRGGETSREGRDRLAGLIDLQIYPNAEVLLYWQGGNDLVDLIRDLDPLLLVDPNDFGAEAAGQLDEALDAIQGHIEAAIMMARDAGWTVLVATYYPIREELAECDALPFGIVLPGQAARANAYRQRLNDRIEQAAALTGAVLVDVAGRGASLSDSADNYHDCNHLSRSGNERVAELFADALRQRGY